MNKQAESTNSKDSTSIKWHSPIYRGLQLDLRGNELKYQDEFPLSEEAYIVDAIVWKEPHVEVQNDIGKIFKGHNVCEFKSEQDSFSKHDYMKVLGYASLYTSQKQLDPRDVTITIITTMHPRETIKFLNEWRGLKVEERYQGIYYVVDEIFPTQIVETKKLSDDNLFLQSLRSNLNNTEMKKILHALKDAGITDRRDAYLACIIKANWNNFLEVVTMTDDMKDMFLEAAEERGWLSEWVNKRNEKHATEYAKEIAKTLLSFGDPIEKVALVTKLPIEIVEAMA